MDKPAVVLIVEDEAVLLRTMARLLQSEHYDIVTSLTARGALMAIEAIGARVRLLITDVILTDKSGLELAKEAEAINPRLRTLFITGAEPPPGEEHRTFLKPFDSLALRRRVLIELALNRPERP